jgi:hypothetical protein
MPKKTSEVTQGAQFSRSSQEGASSDSQTRVFKVLLEYAGEVIDVQLTCGIYVGYRHPYNTNIYCTSFDARFDGDSRMVLICTFNYAPKAGLGLPDPQSLSPDVRPANWSTSIATYESPVRTWTKVTGGSPSGGVKPAANPMGDMYDGVSRLEPIVTISVEQYEPTNPFKNNAAVGCINQADVVFGVLLTCARSTLLLRSIQTSPVVESWGSVTYRGWKATYEFLYKKNPTYIYSGGAYIEMDIGWDVAVPQTGFNVKAFAPNTAAGDQDIYSQPLKHSKGKIIGPPYLLPDNVTAGDKVRAMVKVFEYENGGASQTPSAQPIPLNDDGTPRLHTADPKVLVYRYRVYKEADFNSLYLRLT